MQKKIKQITLWAMLSVSLINAQEKQVRRASADFESYAYADAIDSYERLIDKGYSSEAIYKNLGNANYKTANYDAAANWYAKLFELEHAEQDPDDIYKYAQSLKSLEKYEESNKWMKRLEAIKAEDTRAVKFENNLDYLEKIKEVSGSYQVENLPINSKTSDFAPSLNGEQLVFSSGRDKGLARKDIHEWNNEAFLNLYSVTVMENGELAAPIKLSKKLNKKTHESSTAFSKDGKTMYFTRNNSKKGNFARDKNGYSRLKIYRAELRDEEWTNIRALPFNSDDYSVAHPSLNNDESKLYFASDMAGSLGESDIFMVDIMKDGAYGTPVNLGDKVNTEGRETFPFVTQNDVLYFSSDGHPGLGGLDVFATNTKDKENMYVVNIGEPVNSKEDDFSFVLNEETKKGFFASNRAGGQGSDDIYGFTQIKEIDFNCTTIVDGMVKDKETGLPLKGADVRIVNSNNELVAQSVSGPDGIFSIEGNCKKEDYRVMVSLMDYESNNTIFTVDEISDIARIEISLTKTVVQPKIGDDLIVFLSFEPVYFDLDKSDIRPDAAQTIQKVASYLKLFPSVNIEVQSHTDVKAGNDYNQRLSQRRAKATVAYLIEQGVDESRLSGQGFGETRLINNCTTREKCEDVIHQRNRRSEFVVVE